MAIFISATITSARACPHPLIFFIFPITQASGSRWTTCSPSLCLPLAGRLSAFLLAPQPPGKLVTWLAPFVAAGCLGVRLPCCVAARFPGCPAAWLPSCLAAWLPCSHTNHFLRARFVCWPCKLGFEAAPHPALRAPRQAWKGGSGEGWRGKGPVRSKGDAEEQRRQGDRERRSERLKLGNGSPLRVLSEFQPTLTRPSWSRARALVRMPGTCVPRNVMYIYIYIYVYIHTYACMFVLYIYIYMYIYIYICVCMCVYIYIYIYMIMYAPMPRCPPPAAAPPLRTTGRRPRPPSRTKSGV